MPQHHRDANRLSDHIKITAASVLKGHGLLLVGVEGKATAGHIRATEVTREGVSKTDLAQAKQQKGQELSCSYWLCHQAAANRSIRYSKPAIKKAAQRAAFQNLAPPAGLEPATQ